MFVCFYCGCLKPMTDVRETRMRNLHEIEHALFDGRNSREKYLAASRSDTRTSFSYEFLVQRNNVQLLYHDLNYAIVIGPMRVTWCAKINIVARCRQCSVMFPGNMAWCEPCSRGTWCKPRDTVHLHRFFGPTAVLGRSIRILCCWVIDDDTNLLHLFRDITRQTLGQHCTTSRLHFSM